MICIYEADETDWNGNSMPESLKRLFFEQQKKPTIQPEPDSGPAAFQMTSALKKFPPQAVIRASLYRFSLPPGCSRKENSSPGKNRKRMTAREGTV